VELLGADPEDLSIGEGVAVAGCPMASGVVTNPVCDEARLLCVAPGTISTGLEVGIMIVCPLELVIVTGAVSGEVRLISDA
jgi:hypothetical protein